MAYKPPKQTIVDNDLNYVPSNEAVFEALKLKLDEPTVSGTNGQLLQLTGYVGGEATTSWINPPNPLPSQTGNLDKVLVTDGTNASWQYAGRGAGNLGTGNIILGIAKPGSLTGTGNTVITGSSSALTSGIRNTLVGLDAGPALTTHSNNTVIGNAAGRDLVGDENTVIGAFALASNLGAGVNTSTGNIVIGSNAGRFGVHTSSIILAYGGNAYRSFTNSVVIGGNQPNASPAVSITGAIILGHQSLASSNEMAVGSSAAQINTVYLGRGGAEQTAANAVKIMTMRASGTTDTDLSAGTLTLAGSQSTGNKVGGDVIIATAPAGAAGSSTTNAHVERLRVTAAGLVQIGPPSDIFFNPTLVLNTWTYRTAIIKTESANILESNNNAGSITFASGNQYSNLFFGASDGSFGNLGISIRGTVRNRLYSGYFKQKLGIGPFSTTGTTNGGILSVTQPANVTATSLNSLTTYGTTTIRLTYLGGDSSIAATYRSVTLGVGDQLYITKTGETPLTVTIVSATTISNDSTDYVVDQTVSVNYTGGTAVIQPAIALIRKNDASTALIVTNSGNVGIGTNSPQSILNVSGSLPQLRLDGTGNTGFFFYDSNIWTGGMYTDVSGSNVKVIATTGRDLRLLAGSSNGDNGEVMRCTSSGRVGIGTVTPAVKLDIVGDLQASGNATLNGGLLTLNSANGVLMNNSGFKGALQFVTDNMRLSAGTGVGIRFTTNSSNGEFNERMRITSAGDIGIGTTTPAQKLDVSGNIQATSGDVMIATAGNGLAIKTGSNAKIGTATFTAQNTVTVNTTAVTANSLIFVTGQDGTNAFCVGNKVAGTSFDIVHSTGNVTAVVAWMIVEATP